MPSRESSGRTPVNRDIEITRLMDSLHTALEAAKAINADMVVYLLDTAIAEMKETVIPQKR